MKKKNIIIVCILVLILILSLIAVVSISLRKKDVQESIPKNETTEGINQGKNIPEEEEIMQVPSVIESKSEGASEPYKGYRLATEIDQDNYQITDVKKSTNSKIATITGKINNTGGSEKIVLKVEFKEKNKTKSSSSIEIKDFKVNKTENFEIKVLNNVATDDYTVYVEYVGE